MRVTEWDSIGSSSEGNFHTQEEAFPQGISVQKETEEALLKEGNKLQFTFFSYFSQSQYCLDLDQHHCVFLDHILKVGIDSIITQ